MKRDGGMSYGQGGLWRLAVTTIAVITLEEGQAVPRLPQEALRSSRDPSKGLRSR